MRLILPWRRPCILPLTKLDLSGCCILSDKALQLLASLNMLKDLNLSGCSQITDIGLQHVCALRSLTNLNVSNCSRITKTGLENLATSLTIGKDIFDEIMVPISRINLSTWQTYAWAYSRTILGSCCNFWRVPISMINLSTFHLPLILRLRACLTCLECI